MICLAPSHLSESFMDGAQKRLVLAHAISYHMTESSIPATSLPQCPVCSSRHCIHARCIAYRGGVDSGYSDVTCAISTLICYHLSQYRCG